ncbi:hypothetical protein CC78DRAFT_303798 [Lojkania enalia]|uniref:Uncharacterized protein n=1 Tax=Lojkania enalia TaxID=147567 RepID=A0A9P4TPS7_9PLEO|nr:hypothetical protein CC78DRAFT_303798 [Didymosphaeria enalia]
MDCCISDLHRRFYLIFFAPLSIYFSRPPLPTPTLKQTPSSFLPSFFHTSFRCVSIPMSHHQRPHYITAKPRPVRQVGSAMLVLLVLMSSRAAVFRPAYGKAWAQSGLTLWDALLLTASAW